MEPRANFLYMEPRANIHYFIIKNKRKETLNRTHFFLFKAKGTSSIYSTCLYLLCYNVIWLDVWGYTRSYTLKFLCIFFSGLDHTAFNIIIWFPCWVSVLQRTFPAKCLPPSSPSASWLFAWIAKKDKGFQGIAKKDKGFQGTVKKDKGIQEGFQAD